MSFGQPDRYFDHITSIDIQDDIVGQGYRCVLLDIDNTIRSREDGKVPADIMLWIRVLRSSGVKVCIVSNNWHDNAHKLARDLKLPIVAKACKPLPVGFLAARRKMGIPRRETLMIGDQLSTDIWGAHVFGMPAYLVEPLGKVDLKHTVYVRKVESLFIKDMEVETD